MQNAFYRSFIDEKEKIVSFIGGGGKSTLIRRLAKDCARFGKKVVILSQFPYFTPMEAKTVISDDPALLCRQVNAQLADLTTLYIGKSYKHSTITNFNLTEIKTIIKRIEPDHVFIEADSAGGRSLSGYTKISVSLLQESDRYINIIGADSFNQIKNDNWLSAEDNFWRKKKILSPMDIGAWFNTSTLFLKISDLPVPATYFINKVENIYIENTAIPLAKNFKIYGIERVITGSVFNSNLHLIK